MRSFILGLMVLVVQAAQAGEVLVFVNLHHSVTEAKIMKEAADALGQKFVEIPSADEVAAHLLRRKSLESYKKELRQRLRNFEKNSNAQPDEPPTGKYDPYRFYKPKLADAQRGDIRSWSGASKREQIAKIDEKKFLKSEYARVDKELEDTTIVKNMVASKLKALTVSGDKITTLAVSGHDGGGHLYATDEDGEDKQNIELADLVSLVPKAARKDVKNVALMGCYAGTRIQVGTLRSGFQNMSMFMGYDGRSPLENTPASGLFVKQTLISAQKILKETDTKKLMALVNSNVPVFKNLNATLYFAGACGDTYISKMEGCVSTLSITDCKERVQKFVQSDLPDLKKFFSGELPIPEDTSNGRLREVYSHYRQNEYCLAKYRKEFKTAFGDQAILSGDEVLQLLFWKNYVTNASRALADLVVKMEYEDVLIHNQNEVCETSLQNCARIKKLIQLSKDLKANPDYFANMSRKAIADLASELVATQASFQEKTVSGRVQYITEQIEERVQEQMYSLAGEFLWHEPPNTHPAFSVGETVRENQINRDVPMDGGIQ